MHNLAPCTPQTSINRGISLAPGARFKRGKCLLGSVSADTQGDVNGLVANHAPIAVLDPDRIE